jgi:hypothetical protein
MNRKLLGKWIAIFGLVIAGILLLISSSCARDQQLIGITIQPGSVTFGAPDPQQVANLTALGTYIHPPETKDITAQVSWSSDIPQLVAVSGGAVSPTGGGCGEANISASYNHGTGPSGNLVIGYATVTVDDPNVPGCPGGGGGAASPVLSVLPEPTNSAGDSVTSSPAGINCPGQTCGAAFASGTVVTLTATPSANFVVWGVPCSGLTSNVCPVTLTTDTTVIATFQ